MKLMERLLEQTNATIHFYEMFTFFEYPEIVSFNDFFRNKDFQFVQVYNFSKATKSGMTMVYRGVFSWKNNEIISLDGNSYDKKMNLCGFCILSSVKTNTEILYIIVPDVNDDISFPEDVCVYDGKFIMSLTKEQIDEMFPEEKSQK